MVNKENIKKQIIKPELLAPAGNLEKLEFAIRYGADAVYIGGQQFGLRSKAGNFSLIDIIKGVDFAHQNGAKIYVVVNIIAHDQDLVGLEDYLKGLYSAGVDAIIVADAGIISVAKTVVPDLEIHLSTQASTTNWQAVKFWKDEGIARIVLAREVSLKEIKEIKEHVDIEVETFIHGAMCNSFSGRCILSNHMTNRDANRGGCAQSCRWSYDLYQTDYPEEKIFNENYPPYTMSSKDMCTIDAVPDLIDAGINSLKIEGRMKSIHYVATIVNAYRHAIDSYFDDISNYSFNPNWYDEILKASHRPIFKGFYYEQPDQFAQIYEDGPKLRRFDFVGRVLDYDRKTQIATIEQRNNFKIGQEVDFFGPKTKFIQKIESIKDEKGSTLDAARHPLQIVKVKVDKPVYTNDMMRKEN